jgi:hypothetical protein
VFSTHHARLRVQRAPGIPHALCYGRKVQAQLGRIASRDRDAVIGFAASADYRKTGAFAAIEPKRSAMRMRISILRPVLASARLSTDDVAKQE